MDFSSNDPGIIIIICLLTLIVFPVYITIKKRILTKRLKIRAEKAARKIRERSLVMDYNRKSYHWENDH